MSLTLLTVTGDRQACFSRLERWIARQTYPVDNWLVVCDGHVPTRCTMGQTFIRMEPGKEAKASFAANYMTGLMACRSSKFVAVIEDDDAYSQDYLARLIPLLATHALAGESFAKYYNVQHRAYREMGNDRHASLCQTAFRGSLIPCILPLINERSAFLDTRMWCLPVSKILKPSRCSVGLKGQVGRKGIGCGHSPNLSRWKHDPDGTVLKQWIGEEDAAEVLTMGATAV